MLAINLIISFSSYPQTEKLLQFDTAHEAQYRKLPSDCFHAALLSNSTERRIMKPTETLTGRSRKAGERCASPINFDDYYWHCKDFRALPGRVLRPTATLRRDILFYCNDSFSILFSFTLISFYKILKFYS